MGDVPPDDPHRGAKWFAGLLLLSAAALQVWNVFHGNRAARREGYRAGRAAAEARAPVPSRGRKR